MYTREQLQGILLTVARPEVTIYRSDRSKTGYTLRVRVMFRANRNFLIALQRRFEQANIKSILRDSEGVNRDAPVLIVGKKESVNNLREIMPELPCSHSNWDKFDLVMRYINDELHLEQEHMDELIELVKSVNK